MIRNLIFMVCLMAMACKQNRVELKGDTNMPMASSEQMEMEPPLTAEPPAPPIVAEVPENKIIKTGEVRMEVLNLEDAKKKLDTLIKVLKGYYENETYTSEGNQNTFRLIIRIPHAKFDSTMLVLEKGPGRILFSNINLSDVTEEYTDVTIRLKNHLAYLEQYRNILKKANRIEDIMAVQEKIRVLEEEIDSKEGRLKYLDDQVAYSTLTVEMMEWKTTHNGEEPVYLIKVVNAFKEGLQLLFDMILWLIWIWPIGLVFLIIYLFRKVIINKFRKGKGDTKNVL
ncbi:MAG: DUF4349 domain-containing protein [Saprospiraceae bacterium]